MVNDYRSRVQARLCQKFDEVAQTGGGKGSRAISIVRRMHFQSLRVIVRSTSLPL